MTSVYLIRHAQAQGNVLKRFQGRTDLPLTRVGRQQIHQLAARMRAIPLHAVYTSPLERAAKTAAGLAKPHKLKPIVCPGLVEMDGGAMENLGFEEIHSRYPEDYTVYVETPHLFMGIGGGETMAQVFSRMQSCVLELVEQNRGQTIALVSHGAAIRCFACFASGLPLEKLPDVGWGDNTAVSHITFDTHNKPMVHYLFDSSHLSTGILPVIPKDESTIY